MGEVSTIGVDLAKNVFQVHGADASGTIVFAGNCAGTMCWGLSPRSQGVLWRWKHVAGRITGVGRSVGLAMR